MSYEMIKQVLERMKKDPVYAAEINRKYQKIYKMVGQKVQEAVEEIQSKGGELSDALIVAKILEFAFNSFTLEQHMTVLALLQSSVEDAREEGYSAGFNDGVVRSLAMTLQMVKMKELGN